MALLNSCIAFLLSALLFTSCRNKIDIPEDVQVEMQKITRPVDYAYDVKPILSDRCFACHGPDANKQQGGLRLDLAKVAFEKTSESGLKTIVPGTSASSEMAHRILSIRSGADYAHKGFTFVTECQGKSNFNKMD